MRHAPFALPVSLLVVLSLVACERVEPTGNPFEPVAVESAPDTRAPSTTDEWSFPRDKPVDISSEQLGRGGSTINVATAMGVTSTPVSPVPSTTTPVPAAVTPAASTETAASTLPPAPKAETKAETRAAAATASGRFLTAGAWPIRLIATVPGAQPPRAILGMPDGKELVVSPGTLVPDAGVVIVAIGNNTADIAQIRPAGDHAEIKALTLHAQR